MSLGQISRENRIYLAIWRKVAGMEDDLTIKLTSHTEAVSMRLGLYRAMTPYRSGDMTDPELAAVADTHSVFIAPKSSEIVIRRKIGLLAAEGLMEELGIGEDDLITYEEKELSDRMTGLMTDLSAGKDNPFYKGTDR